MSQLTKRLRIIKLEEEVKQLKEENRRLIETIKEERKLKQNVVAELLEYKRLFK